MVLLGVGKVGAKEGCDCGGTRLIWSYSNIEFYRYLSLSSHQTNELLFLKIITT